MLSKKSLIILAFAFIFSLSGGEKIKYGYAC
jgi:hypothetical protein